VAGQTTFYLGERIQIQMSFTGPNDKSFGMTLRNYDRSGRLDLDDFAVSPSTGWADPLVQYLAYNSSIGGGLFTRATLSPEPIIRFENLNEWVRFDEPGVYTVTVTSHRVSPSHKERHLLHEDTLVLQSNRLQIRIVPATPKWQKAKLDAILRELAIPQPPQSETSPSRRAAMEDLRYLASPGAIAELAADLRDDRQDLSRNAFFGIVGLGPLLRETALKAMDRLVEDPTFPVSPSFLEAIPQLQMEDAPLPSKNETDDENRKLGLTYDKKRQPLRDEAWQAVASALEHKAEPARGITAQTLADALPKHPSPADIELIGSVVRSSFPHLSAAAKASLLIDQWDLIRSPDLLPQLRVLSKLPAKYSEPNGMLSGSPDNLRAIALRRWYEFEPEPAKQEVLHQIGSATPALSALDIDFLPPEPLPEFETIWAKAFAKSTSMESDLLGSLLIRFGTGAVAAQIAPLATQPTSDFSCNRQIDALAYLVHFDPQSAQPILQHASDNPKELTLCYGAPLNSVSKLAHDPVLNKAALQALNSPHSNVVQDALQYLTGFGVEADRQPILDGYLKWYERWTGQPEVPGDKEHREQQNDLELGDQFAGALLANQGWIPDAALKATVLKHCVGKPMCDAVQNLSEEDLPISASQSPYGTEFHIGALSIPSLKLFEAKLDQYPKGTEFTIVQTMTGYPGEQRSIEASLPELLEKHGMKIHGSDR
jgi:hypothetical protein